MSEKHILPEDNWHTELANIIDKATDGDTVVVRTVGMAVLEQAPPAWDEKPAVSIVPYLD